MRRNVSETVDQLRIRYRWKVLDAENQAIREHRQKKKEAKSKAERERIGKWEPERTGRGVKDINVIRQSGFQTDKTQNNIQGQSSIIARKL